MQKLKTKPIEANIPTASMADIAFLLIIFFMVTTVFTVDRTNVNLPLSEKREEVPKGAAVITITIDQMMKFSGGREESFVISSAEDLISLAAAEVAKNSLHPFVVKADGEVPYRAVDEVMDRLKQAGVQVMILLTNQETVDGA